MKVCVIDPSLFTLPYDRHLCAGLRAAGADVTLCGRALRSEEILGAHDFEFVPRCYPLSEGGATGRRRWWPASFKALEHVATARGLSRWLHDRFDVLHFQWSPLPLADGRQWRHLARERTIIFTVHDTTPFLGRPTSRLQTLGWRRLLDIAHGLIVHTHASRRDLEHLGIPASRISVIPHGTLQPACTQEVTTEPAGSADGRRTILVFGEIKPYKGLDVLLRAMAELPRPIAAGWRLVVAGRPRCEIAPLQRLAANLDIPVEWRLGFVPEAELSGMLRSADLVAFPYRRVDASGALMLALPFGVPVVASMVGLFREMLVDGVTAALAEPDDVRSLTHALERVMSDEALRARLRANVLDQVQRLWAWPAIAQAHLAVYARHHVARGGMLAGAATYSMSRPAPADTPAKS